MFPVDSHIRCPTNFTLNNSWVSSTLLSPCSYAVNSLALKTESESDSRKVQTLQYFAKPIDSIIQAVSMIVFTFYDHFRDISYDVKNHNIKISVIKSLTSPIVLPLKIFCAVIGSVGFLLGGASQLVIPYQTIYSVVKGKQAAHLYFYENEVWRSQFDDNSFRMKPIVILKPFDIDDSNPFCSKRKSILEEIDGAFRKRIGYKLDICNAYPEYEELSKNKKNNEKFIVDNVLSQDENTQKELIQAKQSLSRFEEIREKIRIAEAKWEEIDRISIELEAVINDGIPFIMRVKF